MNAPNLRYEEFNDPWKTILLSDIMTFSNGINADKDSYGHGRKFINVLDILNNNSINYENIIGSVSVSEKVEETNKVEYGDLVFLRSSETREDVGKSSVYLDKDKFALFGGFVIRGKKQGDYHPYFLKLNLESPKVRNQISSKAGGSTRFNVSQSILSSIEINLPCLYEQEKIANFIETLDVKIQLQKEKIDLLIEQKKGYMQKIFNRELRFKDESGEEYSEWKLTNISNIAKIVGGGTPNTQNQSFWSGDIPWISSSDLTQENYYDINFYRYINQNAINNSATHLIPPNSIAIVTRVGLGKIAYVTQEYCTSQDFQNLINFKENPIFLVHAIAIELNKIITMSQGTSIKGVTKKELESINIFLPSKEEQNKIGAFLKVMDMRIQKHEKKLNILVTQKQAFMQQMFI